MIIKSTNNFLISNGNRAQLKFPLLCWDMGWECAEPTLESLPYDFVCRGMDDSKLFKTVQVKQAYEYADGRQRCDIRKKGKKNTKIKYECGDFDILAAYKPSSKDWYIIPWEEISNVKSEINLSREKWNQFRLDHIGV